MNISIITLFPELYDTFLKTSIVGKAKEKELINPELINFLDFCAPKERADSPTYGHGSGMLIKPELVESAIETQEKKLGKAFKIFFSPHGKKLDQNYLKELSKKLEGKRHLLLVASRYEGMDSRVEEYYADEVVSLGDFVLMGGDLPVMCFMEGLLRLFPGIVGKQDSVENDSFSGPFVDYPEYTAPLDFKGMQVPEVIRSGNHKEMANFRKNEAVRRTVLNHFDWARSSKLSKEDKKLLKQHIPNHYAVLMHGDVLLKDKTVGTTSVTSLDIHDIARSAKTFGIEKYFIVTPLKDQQNIVNTLMDFWKSGYGTEYNVHRHQAIKSVQLNNNIDEVVKAIEEIEGKKPLLISTSAKYYQSDKYITFFDQGKVWESQRPVLLIFGTGHGLSDQILNRCDFILEPICGLTDFNHLSVRSAAAIIFDRWLGLNIKYR